MPLDFSDAEKAALVELLKVTIAADRFPRPAFGRSSVFSTSWNRWPATAPRRRQASGVRCLRRNGGASPLRSRPPLIPCWRQMVGKR